MRSFILFSIDLTDLRTDIAQVVSTEPSAQYSVLSRAWDGVIDGVKLIIVVKEPAAESIMKDALKAIEDNKFQFKPSYEVISQTVFHQGDLVLFSCHPANFYTLYLSKADEKALRKAVTTLGEADIRLFPEGNFIAEKFSTLPVSTTTKTISHVTSGSMHVASITPRYRSQNAVMSDISAPTVGIFPFLPSHVIIPHLDCQSDLARS